jgi:hypothetical protein
MGKLGHEYIGKLPPGAAEDLAYSLREYQDAAIEGIVKGVEILPGPGCAVAEAQAGTVYPVDKVPKLPLQGCVRSPCCGCCYSPVLA